MLYSVREALAAFRRAPLLVALSVVAIGLSLFVVGLFGLVSYNVHRAITGVEERVEAVAYLRESATGEQIALAEREIAALPEVSSVRYVSKMEALATAMQEMQEFRDVFSDLESNPLPPSFEVHLKPEAREPEQVARVARYLGAYPFVEDVRYGREWLDKVHFLRRTFGGAALVLGAAFASVAAIIIAAAVRVAVFARRDEIGIMRLVGATNGFVRRPFLLEGVFTGLLGGLLAAGLTWAAFRLVDGTLMRIEWVPTSWVALTVAGGTLFGFLASAVAVRRHLVTL